MLRILLCPKILWQNSKTLIYSSNTIFGFTEPGQGKNKTECQDSYSIIDIAEDHLKYFAVYDGHGHVGKSVSYFQTLIIHNVSWWLILYEFQIGLTFGKRICWRTDPKEF